MNKEIAKEELVERKTAPKHIARRVAAAISVGAELFTVVGCPSPVPPEVTPSTPEINVPFIEWLRFDQATMSYLAEAYNPYGLATNEKAGVIVKGAVEINGKMENSIGLKPKVLKVIMAKNATQSIYKIALPFNFEEDRGKITMTELILNNPSVDKLLGIKIAAPTKLYSPLDTQIFEGQITVSNSTITAVVGGQLSEEWGFGVLFPKWNRLITLTPDLEDPSMMTGLAETGKTLGIVPADAFLDFLMNSTNINKPGAYQICLLITDTLSPSRGLEGILKIGNYTVFTLPK